MSKITEKQVTAENLKEFKGRSLAEETARRLMKNKGAIVGMCFLILLVLVAISSEFIFDYDTDITLIQAAHTRTDVDMPEGIDASDDTYFD